MVARGASVTLLVVVVSAAAAPGQGPLTCWSCSSTTQGTHGADCYDLDTENKTFANTTSRTCTPEEVFCTVNQIWYVVEAGAEARNFSVNRTCASTCRPSCVVIGDRTKIHSCTSCCTESFCNMGSSASPRYLNSTPLLLVTLVVTLIPAVPSLLTTWTRSPKTQIFSLPAG